MTIKRSEVLSSSSAFPFGNSMSEFFNIFEIDDDVEIYYFYYWPLQYDHLGSSDKQLSEINYKSKVIFWVAMDSVIDRKTYNFYEDSSLISIQKFEEICKKNLNCLFILLSPQHGLNEFISVKNLFAVPSINCKFTDRYLKCNNKTFKSNHKKWISLNRRPEPHRSALLSYLCSKNLNCYGSLFFDSKVFQYRSMSFLNFFRFSSDQKKQISNGFCKISIGKSQGTKSGVYDKNPAVNYNKNLLHVYETSALEIISGSLFFEPTPFFSEKEIQSIYGKVFPIFINTYNAVSTWKTHYGIDVFEDIIDHSYDSIKDPTERLVSAIDANLHLLDGSVSLEDLWLKNKERFDKNCDQMDKILYDTKAQQEIDGNEIKKALDYYDIYYKLI